jgi:hypothetical protein
MVWLVILEIRATTISEIHRLNPSSASLSSARHAFHNLHSEVHCPLQHRYKYWNEGIDREPIGPYQLVCHI